jgi:hypothetical protein
MTTNTEDGPRSPDPNATIRARNRRTIPTSFNDDDTPRASMYLQEQNTLTSSESMTQPSNVSAEKAGPSRPTLPTLPSFVQFVADPSNASGIAERAWMAKMATEMARRYEEERVKGSFGSAFTRDDERAPPPAYAQ